MTMHDRSLALAGCIQHTWWAHRLAQHGEFDPARIALAAKSVLCTDPGRAQDVFGELQDLKPGIDTAVALLGKQRATGFDAQEMALLTRYVGQILKLSATLLANDQAIKQLAAGVERLKLTAEASQGLEAITAPQLASLYVDNISSLSPRIMVQGNGIYLRNEEFAAGIRSHLLAALRAAVLWRQCGGRLWHLMFQRSAYLKAFMQLQAEIA